MPGLAVALGAAVPALIGGWYRYHPHPISENDAKHLADLRNNNLRRQFGLPAAAREPLIRDVKIAPLLVAGGGFALSGSF